MSDVEDVAGAAQTLTDTRKTRRSNATSLRMNSTILFDLMPAEIRTKALVAVFCASALGFLEFASVILLYPVFGFLASGNGADTFSLPILGVQIDHASARWIAITALGLMILRSVLSLAYRRWWLGTTARAEVALSGQLMGRYAYAPYSFHLVHHSSDLMTRAVAHVNLACTSGLVGIVGAISDGFIVLGLAGALVAASPAAGAVVVIYVGVLATLYSLMVRGVTKRLSARLAERISAVYKRVSVLLRGIRELTVFGLRERYLSEIREGREGMVRDQLRLAMLQETPRVVLEVVLYGTILVVLTVLLASNDPDSVLPLVALYVLVGMRIMPALARVLGEVGQARSGMQIASQLSDEISEISAITVEKERHGNLEGRKLPLELADVSFVYQGTSVASVCDVSLDIPFGTYLGVIGASGSGKSTLASVILGLLAPTTGRVEYGGQPVVQGDAGWFERLAVVPQDVFLTDGTLRENLLSGNDSPSESDIHAAIASAGLTELVEALPEGLETPLEEGGGRLSAGQRQRVGLARALVRSPEILVLDEPTGALDSATEARVVSAIDELRGRMTVISIAHRTETLRNADLIARMDAGRIIQIGPPFEVIGEVSRSVTSGQQGTSTDVTPTERHRSA